MYGTESEIDSAALTDRRMDALDLLEMISIYKTLHQIQYMDQKLGNFNWPSSAIMGCSDHHHILPLSLTLTLAPSLTHKRGGKQLTHLCFGSESPIKIPSRQT